MKTDVTLVVDRSGSMYSRATDATLGIKAMMEDQAKQEGETRVSLMQFDGESEWVVADVPPEEVVYDLVPRGMTALNDALGRAITTKGAQFRRMDEDKRPDKIIFVVVTDGCENSSKEYTIDQIREMVKHQEDKYSWEFVYLGVGIEGFEQGLDLGFDATRVADYDPGKTQVMYAAVTSHMNSVRSGNTKGFDDVVRASMK